VKVADPWKWSRPDVLVGTAKLADREVVARVDLRSWRLLFDGVEVACGVVEDYVLLRVARRTGRPITGEEMAKRVAQARALELLGLSPP
jgi:hypothetical protein